MARRLTALVLAAGALVSLPLTAGSARVRAGAAAACVVPGTRLPLESVWRPDMAAATAYARTRVGDITFAVRTLHRFSGYRPDHIEWSASVVKAMLLVAYLDRPSVAERALDARDNALLDPMITHSDNNAAQAVDDIVGNAGLSALAARVGMTHFTPVKTPWGETQITARDQTRFLLGIDGFLAPRHRAYAMHLLASITPSQRWGIGEVAPRGWQLFFKGGWGSGTGLLDHQVVLLRRGCARVSLAVLTMHDGSHAYGKATLKGIFTRLLRGFPTGAPAYPVLGGARYTGRLLDAHGVNIGTISFTASRNGESISFPQIALNAAAPCGGGGVSGGDPLAVDPRGHFATADGAVAVRLHSSLTGRFVTHRAASGTFALGNRNAPECDISASWTARAQ